MTLYCLHIAPNKTDTADHFNEWFETLKGARKRRRELIKLDPMLVDHKLGYDFQIDRVRFSQTQRYTLTKKMLVVACLNKRWIAHAVVRIAASSYRPKTDEPVNDFSCCDDESLD